ncbi:MAG TPA: S1 RNA-binding domain-containing protein [Candidatus Saccharimonadales bacterium]|nr:S1 RNA-binding domain-containing protein [Candidatus Saccharimonadales bacterium]
MLIKKQTPSEKELVLVKISKIMPHGAYCELVEYGMDAYLPISEIASGWIKNIHEFIKEGQKDVGRVIAIDKEKRAVDVSLKKVTTKEKNDKISEYNLEKRYEKLFSQALSTAKLEAKKDAIISEIAQKAATYTEIIQAFVDKKDVHDMIKNKALEDALAEIVSKNIKPKRYEVSYVLELRATDPKAGVSEIKQTLKEIEAKGVGVLYIGAPRYRLTSEDSDYPKAEGRIKEAQKIIEKQKHLAHTMKSEKLVK